MIFNKHSHQSSFSGNWAALISLSTLIWISGVSAQSAPKVTFINPAPEGGSVFWTQTIEIMQAAAEDLEIDLKIVYSRSNSYSQKKDGLEALDSRPDYFLSGYWMTSSQYHIKHAEQLGIRTFTFNSGVAPEERLEMGQPRGKYRHWIGLMTPDDYQAAYTLADVLINKAKAAQKTDKAGKVHLIVIGGDGIKNSVEEKRYSGVKKRITEHNDAVLDELILTGWDRNTAYKELLGALERHPETTAIWSISGSVSMAAIDAVQNLGKIPGKDIFIGGFNWSLENINAVASNRITALLGGHFVEGPNALVLIHDHYHGIDFADELGVEMETQLGLITADNAREYLNKLSKADWRQVDFKQFSKKYNPGLKRYNLTLETLLKNLELE